MDSNSAMFVMFARKPFFLLTYCKTVPWNVNCNAPSLVCKSVVMKKFVVVHNVHPVLPPQCSFDERVDSLSRLVLPVHLDMTTQRQLNYDMLATQASFNSFIPPTYISLMLKLYIQLSEICQHLRLSEWSMSSETRHSTACCWITIQHAEAQNNSTASCEYDRIREAIVRLWHRMKLSLVKLLIVTIETSLDREDESRNFFSRSRIKFLKVRYREMTLGHTQCAWTTQSIWLPDRGWLAGHPGKDGGNCLWSLVCVVGGLHLRCLLWCIVRLLKALVHVYTVSCAHTSDPVSLHCDHGLYNLWLQLAMAGRICSSVMLPGTSTACECTDFHT